MEPQVREVKVEQNQEVQVEEEEVEKLEKNEVVESLGNSLKHLKRR